MDVSAFAPVVCKWRRASVEPFSLRRLRVGSQPVRSAMLHIFVFVSQDHPWSDALARLIARTWINLWFAPLILLFIFLIFFSPMAVVDQYFVERRSHLQRHSEKLGCWLMTAISLHPCFVHKDMFGQRWVVASLFGAVVSRSLLRKFWVFLLFLFFLASFCSIFRGSFAAQLSRLYSHLEPPFFPNNFVSFFFHFALL